MDEKSFTLDDIKAGERCVMLGHAVIIEIGEADGTGQWDTQVVESGLGKTEDEIWVDVGRIHDAGGDFIDGKIFTIARSSRYQPLVRNLVLDSRRLT